VDLIEGERLLERKTINIKKIVTLDLIFSLAFGAIYYQFGRPDGNVLKITGEIENELSIYYYNYEDEHIVINTEMMGKCQYEPRTMRGYRYGCCWKRRDQQGPRSWQRPATLIPSSSN